MKISDSLFYWKFGSLFGGAFFELLALGLMFWRMARGRVLEKTSRWMAATGLILGAGLVLLSAILARDLVLFVGQVLAAYLFLTWLLR